MVTRLLAAVMALLAAGGLPRVALANGGHIHIYGNVGIPTTVGYILGGVVGLMFVWLITLWAVSYRRLQREQGATAAPEEEDDHGLEE